MAKPLTRKQLLDRLSDSLRVIELGVQLYDAGELVAWMPIATELYKLLIGDRYGALVPELFPDLRFHPVRSRISKGAILYKLRVPKIRFDEKRIAFDLFDLDVERVTLDVWLQQDIAEVGSRQLVIADFVTIMRHNVSAHTSRKVLGAKQVNSGTLQG